MRKVNKKGFTIVELLTSFSLASVVMILLFNILLTIKENYIHNKLETEFESQFALLATALNEDAFKCSGTGSATNNLYFTSSDVCQLNRIFIGSEQKDGKTVITYRRYKSTWDYADTTYEFPEGVSLENIKLTPYTVDGTSTNRYYVFNLEFKITYPESGEEEKRTMKIFYK